MTGYRRVSVGILVAFLAALTLASAPQLHERLHGANSHHECAATLVASGNYHSVAPPALTAKPLPKIELVYALPNSAPVCAVVPSSILEHAPPTSL
jgi:hypothetical protein